LIRQIRCGWLRRLPPKVAVKVVHRIRHEWDRLQRMLATSMCSV
jgi:hypothetical protein